MTRTELLQKAMELRKYVRKGNMGDPVCKDAIAELLDIIVELLRLKERR